MKKGSIITLVLVLTTLLAVLTGCAGHSTATASSPVPTNIIPTPNQTAGIPSQGASILSPTILPQGSATGVPPPVVPVPAPGVPSPGISSAGAAVSSAGMAAPNAARLRAWNSLHQPTFFHSTQFRRRAKHRHLGHRSGSGVGHSRHGEFDIGGNSQASTVAEAQNSASTSMNAVIQVLKNKGVADKDITTVGFNIYPTYNYKDNTITGYQVSNPIIAKIRSIADAGSIIDGVTKAGGNLIRISSISFSVDDPNPFLKQARQLAVADASAKASQLAAATGVKLGLPIFVTETTGNYVPVPIYYAAGAASAPAPTTPINPGVSQISVNVQIVYAIQ